VVNKKSKSIVCLSFSNGKKHDFRLFKESKTKISPKAQVLTDTGYQGLQKLHKQTLMPQKRSKKQPLTKKEKLKNVIGVVKRFKVISDRYRNRRKRFGLRFNLVAGIYNLELQ
jgi:hypothetical protein